MLSVRVPLATIADQQQLQLSPLKRLSLADKENTVSAAPAPAGSGVALAGPTREGGGWTAPAAAHARVSPSAPHPQRDPRPGQQGCEENLPGPRRAGEWPLWGWGAPWSCRQGARVGAKAALSQLPCLCFPPKCLPRVVCWGRPSLLCLPVRRVTAASNVTATHTKLPVTEST